jgi:hypothetical protein
MDDATLELAMDTLSGERRLIDIHFAGGEPTLNPPLLLKAIRLAAARGIRMSYVETNGFFGTSVERARELFLPLREAGLPAVLLSVSPYHNEGMPLRHTLNALEAALEVFGEDGVFPWLGHFLPMIAKMDPETPHELSEFLEANGMRRGDGELLRLFPLTPGGRTPEGLGEFFTRRQADFFEGGHCLEMLTGVNHFHIDPHGNLFTGHCPGIVSGRLPDLHAPKHPERHPVFVALATGGPHALMETARKACGFEPDAAGYISPCDLCFQVRKALSEADPRGWPKLGPAEYYSAGDAGGL